MKKSLKKFGKFSDYIEKDDHFFIKMMALIADKGYRVITWEEYYELAKKVDYLTEEECKILLEKKERDEKLIQKRDLLNIFRLDLLSPNAKFYNHGDKNIYDNIHISLEHVINLLDFLELKHAKQNAKEAKKQSNWAIGLSILALITSIVIGIIQLNSSVTINENQLNSIQKNNYLPKLDSINYELQKMNEKLDKVKPVKK